MPNAEMEVMTSCLSRTSLAWTSDGELSAEDMQQVLNRLKELEQDQGPCAGLQAVEFHQRHCG
jgi:hypothetical protein